MAIDADLMNVSKLRDTQIDRLIELGFNKRLGLSPAAYRSRFPEITPRPAGYKGRFDLFLVIEADPSAGLKYQHRELGIKEFTDSEKLITRGFQPRVPYCIWTHDGKRYDGKSIGKAMETFAEDEMPCSQLEVTSLFIHYSELFKGCGIDSGRTYAENGYYSTLLWVQEHPELALRHPNDFTPGLSVLSRGA